MNGFQLNFWGLIFNLLGLLIVYIILVLKLFVGFFKLFVGTFKEFFRSFKNFYENSCMILVLFSYPITFLGTIAVIIWFLGLFLGVFSTLIDLVVLYVLITIFFLVMATLYGEKPTLKLEKHTLPLETRLYSSIPIIGHLLQIEAVLELLKDGTPQSLSLLVQTFYSYKNCQTLAFVLNWLGHIKKQSYIDAICKIWTNTRDKDLEKLLVKEKWVASTPADVRVLSALKTKQLKYITNGEAEIIVPLLNALQDRDSEIANQASKCAILFDKPEHQEFLYRLVIEQDHPIARQVAIKAQYIPKDPVQKSLFYFMTEQWDKCKSLDFDKTLSKKAYELANELMN